MQETIKDIILNSDIVFLHPHQNYSSKTRYYGTHADPYEMVHNVMMYCYSILDENTKEKVMDYAKDNKNYIDISGKEGIFNDEELNELSTKITNMLEEHDYDVQKYMKHGADSISPYARIVKENGQLLINVRSEDMKENK